MTRSERGYTLVEVTIAAALTSIMAVFTIAAFLSGSRIAHVNFIHSSVSAEARRGLEEMSKELRNSNLARIVIPQAGVIQFQIPTNIDQNGNIQWSGFFQYSRGGIGGEQIVRQDMNSGATTVLGNHITNLQFQTTANPATVVITLTAQDATPDGINIPVNMTSALELRN